MIKQQLKSKTIVFNSVMGLIDMAVANAALLQDFITVKEFAVSMLILKAIQTVGNIYLRNITTEAIADK